ncbi:MAG: hypothetical protein ACC628_16760 [Pirellulaceae bacterium]
MKIIVKAASANIPFNSNLLSQIDPGQTSSLLLMSSPQSYLFTSASILDSGRGATGARTGNGSRQPGGQPRGQT